MRIPSSSTCRSCTGKETPSGMPNAAGSRANTGKPLGEVVRVCKGGHALWHVQFGRLSGKCKKASSGKWFAFARADRLKRLSGSAGSRANTGKPPGEVVRCCKGFRGGANHALGRLSRGTGANALVARPRGPLCVQPFETWHFALIQPTPGRDMGRCRRGPAARRRGCRAAGTGNGLSRT